VAVSKDNITIKFATSIDFSFHEIFLWSMRCCLIAAPQNNCNSKLKHYWSQITKTDIILLKRFEILRELPKCDTETRSEYMLLEKWRR
jgi:hypothetical protein